MEQLRADSPQRSLFSPAADYELIPSWAARGRRLHAHTSHFLNHWGHAGELSLFPLIRLQRDPLSLLLQDDVRERYRAAQNLKNSQWIQDPPENDAIRSLKVKSVIQVGTNKLGNNEPCSKLKQEYLSQLCSFDSTLKPPVAFVEMQWHAVLKWN